MNTKIKGKIYFIMGVSWAGKGTLRNNLEQNNSKNIDFIKSYVSRPMRAWEIDWDVYHFVSDLQFKEMIEKNEFLEYEWVHKSAYYGTKISDVLENGILQWKNVMKEIDIEWLKNIYKNHPKLKTDIVSIFLWLSEEKFSQRISARGVDMSIIERNNRIESLRKETQEAHTFCDFIIDTSQKTPEEVLKEVLGIL